MPIIRLYGGECDGYREVVASFSVDPPELFYAVPLAVASKISKMRDHVAKVAADKANRRLAYVFHEVKVLEDDGMVYCYARCAARDKTSDHDPATSL